jgi:hypothetical protein
MSPLHLIHLLLHHPPFPQNKNSVSFKKERERKEETAK